MDHFTYKLNLSANDDDGDEDNRGRRIGDGDGSDGSNEAPVATVTITVNPINDPPKITSVPIIQASDAANYTYDVEATDPDLGDTLTYSLQQAPSGMTIDPTSGLIQWAPTTPQAGNNPVSVRVEDAAGRFDTQR